MAKSQKSNKSIVQPIIRVEGEEHMLEKLFDGDEAELPELKAIGYKQLKGGNTWVSYVITTKGKEVISIEVSEPDLRAIAEENSKISFVQCFMDGTF